MIELHFYTGISNKLFCYSLTSSASISIILYTMYNIVEKMDTKYLINSWSELLIIDTTSSNCG